MNILYVTANVMGDAGANAADIFPRLALKDNSIDRVIVADYPKNKYHIEERQGAEYLRLPWGRRLFRQAFRIARRAKQDDIDVIHVFYRQQNAVLVAFLRIGLLLMWARARIVMDHRSVNLARGWRGWRKKCLNMGMQLFVHHLAGNPWAVETNHFFTFKPKHIIDLGYDTLPEGQARQAGDRKTRVNVWFIGSLKPRNRKSQFLIDTFNKVTEKNTFGRDVMVHVAGPTNPGQKAALKKNPNVTYHGKLPRAELYELLRAKPGIGLAYMNHEFHEYAPSLKFAEYAIMRYKIISSDTIGLKTQARRMNMPDVIFAPETSDAWSDAIIAAAQEYEGLEPLWEDAPTWSYTDIYRRQISPYYMRIKR